MYNIKNNNQYHRVSNNHPIIIKMRTTKLKISPSKNHKILVFHLKHKGIQNLYPKIAFLNQKMNQF